VAGRRATGNWVEQRNHQIGPAPRTSICEVPNHAGTDHETPDDRVDDGDTATGFDDVTSVGEKQLRLLFTCPILLGLFITALNLMVVIRLWKAVYFSNLGLLSRANLPNTVFFTLIAVSFALGLALIVYAIALRHYEEWYDQKTAVQQQPSGKSPSSYEPSRVHPYVKWIIGPLLVALPAPALTVWAAGVIEPISPKPCIEIYRDALNIKKDNPNFRMIWNDRDQLRCSINQVLEQ
jgi:hypothetical protein